MPSCKTPGEACICPARKLSYHKQQTQHGFWKHHSCQTQLLETIHHWAQSLDRRKSVHVAYLDFSKAFDSVPHHRLLLKLDSVGIRGRVLTWISSFLTDRRQRVLLDGCSSDWVNVTSGVPQGSILGPLLFIIYIDDIGSDLTSCTRLFADDCTVFREINLHQDCDSLQADLNGLLKWTQKWQLKLNPSKCKMMCITNKKKPIAYTYHINNSVVEWVDTFKYLGVKIHSNLIWGEQVKDVASRASRVLNLLRHTMHGCHKDKAFTALVHPHLEYCALVWSPYQNKYIDALENVQKRASRWVCAAKWDRNTFLWLKSYSDCRREIGWQTLAQRQDILSCCQIYKMENHLDCLVFEDFLSFNSTVTRCHHFCINCIQSRVSDTHFS